MSMLPFTFIDILQPVTGISPHYEEFLSRYTVITVSAFVSQLSFDHNQYGSDVDSESLEKQTNAMIGELPAASKGKRELFNSLMIGAHLDIGNPPQNQEKRIFVSELFSQKAQSYSLTSNELIVRELNSSAFLNYFFLLEDTIKGMYIDICAPENKKGVKFNKNSPQLGARLLVGTWLTEITKKISGLNIFEDELYARTQVIHNIASLEKLWTLLSYIRNKIAHSNGFYDQDSVKIFNNKLDEFVKVSQENDEHIISSVMLYNEFEKYQFQISEKGYLIIDEGLENIIRNLSVAVMESLYISVKTFREIKQNGS